MSVRLRMFRALEKIQTEAASAMKDVQGSDENKHLDLGQPESGGDADMLRKQLAEMRVELERVRKIADDNFRANVLVCINDRDAFEKQVAKVSEERDELSTRLKQMQHSYDKMNIERVDAIRELEAWKLNHVGLRVAELEKHNAALQLEGVQLRNTLIRRDEDIQALQRLCELPESPLNGKLLVFAGPHAGHVWRRTSCEPEIPGLNSTYNYHCEECKEKIQEVYADNLRQSEGAIFVDAPTIVLIRWLTGLINNITL